jgi:hypothetical protein
MSIIREFEVFLTETVCCFRRCLSVVSVVLVVGFDSLMLMLFVGVLKHSTEQHQQNRNQPEQHTRQMTDSAKRIKSNYQHNRNK